MRCLQRGKTYEGWRCPYPAERRNRNVELSSSPPPPEPDLTIWLYYFALRHKFNKECQTRYKELLGLPWWCSGWESACRCGGHGFEPWSGRIPYAAERLGPWATTAEPARLEPVLRKMRGRDSERPAHRDEEWPPLAAAGESPHTETRTQHSHK